VHRIFVSPQVERLLGYTPTEIQGDPQMWSSLTHPDDRERVELAHRAHLGSAEPLDEEYRMVANDGHVVWVHDRATVVTDGPRGRRSEGIIVDVTERREFERALQRSEERTRQLLRNLVEAQESERYRIANDLHDGPIQTMVASVFHLLTLRPALSSASDLELLDTVHDLVQQSISEMRTVVFDLRPIVLDEIGIAAALREHIELSRFDFDVHVDDGFSDEPPTEVRTVMYRIILEALANVRKHADARHVTIRLAEGPAGYHIEVRDDGRGFDAAPIVSGHLGLQSMQERAESAGGKLVVDSTVGVGTTIDLSIPRDFTPS
jgi:PAS domain S-box-containing protein